MMIVQKVEFFAMKNGRVITVFSSSSSPQNSIVSELLCFYVVVIYIQHFKRIRYHAGSKPLVGSKTIGIMTNSEMRGIRYLRPYAL